MEVQSVKKAQQEYAESKSQRMFINKRNRQITNGWKDGILGVEQPGDKSHFYSDKQIQYEQKHQQRMMRRTQNL